jgi:hypothetical protein
LSYPTTSGDYTFALYERTFGSGTSLSSGNVSESADFGWSTLGSHSFNDVAVSYSLCNDTGSGHTFTVEVYADAYYTTLSQTDSLTLDTGSVAGIVRRSNKT